MRDQWKLRTGQKWIALAFGNDYCRPAIGRFGKNTFSSLPASHSPTPAYDIPP
jgi:hypothetical protein